MDHLPHAGVSPSVIDYMARTGYGPYPYGPVLARILSSAHCRRYRLRRWRPLALDPPRTGSNLEFQSDVDADRRPACVIKYLFNFITPWPNPNKATEKQFNHRRGR